MTATERQRRWCDRAALRPPRGRDDDREQDLWSTPPCLAAALTEIVLPTLPPGPVWEAAAGVGALVDALRVAGRAPEHAVSPPVAGFCREAQWTGSTRFETDASSVHTLYCGGKGGIKNGSFGWHD